METELFLQLIVPFFTGLGLLSAGGVNLLLRRKAGWCRAAATGLTGGGAATAVWLFTGDPRAAGGVALLLLAGLALCLAAGSQWLAAAGAVLAVSSRRPAVRWGLLAAIGVATVIGSIIWYDYRSQLAIDRSMAELDVLTAPPPTAAPERARATTDRGTRVVILEATSLRTDDDLEAIERTTILRHEEVRNSIIHRQPSSDRSNCHGWVFTGGRYWVSGSQVDRILTENDYHAITDPQPGDLAVYRTGTEVAHTALVRYVTDGQPVLVEGKWGCTGVYLHPVDKSIYGTSYVYYRSLRQGHVLAGLESPTSVAPMHAVAMPPSINPANPDELTE